MDTTQSREYIIENKILQYLAKLNIGFFWKNASGGFFDGTTFRKHASPFAINGTSDILGVLKSGRFVALEVKDKGKLSKAQEAFIQKVMSCGGLASVVHSVDDVRQLLESEGVVSVI